jgi:hypothetical protein
LIPSCFTIITEWREGFWRIFAILKLDPTKFLIPFSNIMPRTSTTTIVSSLFVPAADGAQGCNTAESAVAPAVVGVPTTCSSSKISSHKKSFQGVGASSLSFIVSMGDNRDEQNMAVTNMNDMKTVVTPRSACASFVPIKGTESSSSSSSSYSSSSSNKDVGKRKQGVLRLNRSKKECRRSYCSQQTTTKDTPNVSNAENSWCVAETKKSATTTIAAQEIITTGSPDATAHASVTAQAMFVQDAIDGLFMMTQSTAETRKPSQTEIPVASIAAPCDAAAGLLLMTKGFPNLISEMPSNSISISDTTIIPASFYSPGFDKVKTVRTKTSRLDEDMMESECVHSSLVPPCSTVEVVLENGVTPKKGKFTSQEESAWAKRFQQAIDFKRQHGHCRIPYQYPPNNDLVRTPKTVSLRCCLPSLHFPVT